MTRETQYSAARRAHAEHKIAVLVRQRFIPWQRVLNLIALIDPAQRPDRDYLPLC